MDDIGARIGGAAKQFAGFVKKSGKAAAKWLAKQADGVGVRGKQEGFRATATELRRIISGESIQARAADRAKDYFATLGSSSVKGIVADARGSQRISQDLGNKLDKAISKGYKQAQQRLAKLRTELSDRVSQQQGQVSPRLSSVSDKTSLLGARAFRGSARELEIKREGPALSQKVTLASSDDAFAAKLSQALNDLGTSAFLERLDAEAMEQEPLDSSEASRSLIDILKDAGVTADGYDLEDEAEPLDEDSATAAAGQEAPESSEASRSLTDILKDAGVTEDGYELEDEAELLDGYSDGEYSDAEETSSSAESTSQFESTSQAESRRELAGASEDSASSRPRKRKRLGTRISDSLQRLSNKRSRVAVELPDVSASRAKQPDAEVQDLMIFAKPGQKLVFRDDKFELVTGRRSKAERHETADALLARMQVSEKPYTESDLGGLMKTDTRMAKSLTRRWGHFLRMPDTLQVMSAVCTSQGQADTAPLTRLLQTAHAFGPEQAEKMVALMEGQFSVSREGLKEIFLQNVQSPEPQELELDISDVDESKKAKVSDAVTELRGVLHDALEASRDFVPRARAQADKLEQGSPSAQDKQEAAALRDMAGVQEQVAANLGPLLARLPGVEQGESGELVLKELEGLESGKLLTSYANLLSSAEMKDLLESCRSGVEKQRRHSSDLAMLRPETLKALYAKNAKETLAAVIIKPVQTGPRLGMFATQLAKLSTPFKTATADSPFGAWMDLMNEGQRLNELLSIKVQ